MGTELQEVHSELSAIACVQYYCTIQSCWGCSFDCPDKFCPVRSPYQIKKIDKVLGSLLKLGILHGVLPTVSVFLPQHCKHVLLMAVFVKERTPVSRNRHVTISPFQPFSFLIIF